MRQHNVAKIRSTIALIILWTGISVYLFAFAGGVALTIIFTGLWLATRMASALI